MCHLLVAKCGHPQQQRAYVERLLALVSLAVDSELEPLSLFLLRV
jgi:hypothetical protein